jgi:signal transduction histidine kinase
LRSRVFAILIVGLGIAYALSFSVLYAERYMSAKAMMLGTLENDVAASLAVLDHLPADSRKEVVDLLSRDNYRFVIGPGRTGTLSQSARSREIADTLSEAIGHRVPVRMETFDGTDAELQAHLELSDGTPVTIEIWPKGVMPVARWLPYVFAVQMLVIVLLATLAVRLAVLPLAKLAAAADAIDPSKKGHPISDQGPIEVARAARAFNAMTERIAHHMDERVQILAAISHDLQTPITRMRLRADMADESSERSKLLSDLAELERLVQDGLAYSRGSHGKGEKRSRIDLTSFVESISYDYQDTGKPVSISGITAGTVDTKPDALRRILTNLIDNALKFGGAAEIRVEPRDGGAVAIVVMDRGPGIPEDKIEAAMQPFYRLEQSRSRETGGSGLGLAIAQQLAAVLSGSVTLRNRDGGGLMATVLLPRITNP